MGYRVCSALRAVFQLNWHFLVSSRMLAVAIINKECPRVERKLELIVIRHRHQRTCRGTGRGSGRDDRPSGLTFHLMDGFYRKLARVSAIYVKKALTLQLTNLLGTPAPTFLFNPFRLLDLAQVFRFKLRSGFDNVCLFLGFDL